MMKLFGFGRDDTSFAGTCSECLLACGLVLIGEVAGAPEVPAGDRAEGLPFLCAAFDDVGLGKVGRRDLGGRLEALEGEREAFADAVVTGGQDVGATETEDEHHLDGPLADATNLGEVLDDGFVGHFADARKSGDGAVEGFGGEVAECEGLVGGEAGGAELLVGCVEKFLWSGVTMHHRLARVCHVCELRKAAQEFGMDGCCSFAVELLIDDGLGESFEGGLLATDAHGEGARTRDELGEFGVGGGERGDGFVDVVGWGLRAGGVRAGHG
jgi:hypothetical protein